MIDLSNIIKSHQKQDKIKLKINLYIEELKLLKLLTLKQNETGSALIEKAIESYVEKYKHLLTKEIKV